MSQFHVHDSVRLMHDAPDFSLHRGEIGIILSVWCAPGFVYEVEFLETDEHGRTRALLGADYVETYVH